MTRQHDFAPHLSLASAHDYLEMPEIAPSLPAFHRFYQRYGQLAVRVSRVIDDTHVQFSQVKARKMTRDAKRTALVLLESDDEDNEKYYRLFTHQLGKGTHEYRIVRAGSFLVNDCLRPEYISLYHAQAIDQDLDPRYREGLLQLGMDSLAASIWTIDDHDILLETMPQLAPAPCALVADYPRPDSLPHSTAV